jgi:hypothetical protein
MATPPKHKRPGQQPVADPHFDADEDLFRRFSPGNFAHGRIALDAINLPDMSVNRSKYSVPSDALYADGVDYAGYGWGVAAFAVGDVPASLKEGAEQFDFKVAHAPLPNNFSHSEVRAYRGSEHCSWSDDKDPEPAIREMHYRWRWQLRCHLRFVIAPKSPEPTKRTSSRSGPQ